MPEDVTPIPAPTATAATVIPAKGAEHLFMPSPVLDEEALTRAEDALLASVNAKHAKRPDMAFEPKDPFAPPSDLGLDDELSEANAGVGTPVAPVVPAVVITPAVPSEAAQLMARLAEMDRLLAEMKAGTAKTTVKPAPKTTLSVEEIRRDPVRFMKEAGIDMEELAQHMVAAQLGDKAPPEIRLKTAAAKQFGDLRESFAKEVRSLQERLDYRDAQEQARDYERSLQDYAIGVKSEEYPTIGRAIATDKTGVMGDLLEVAREDARVRVAKGDTGQPITAQEAVKRLEAKYASIAKRLGGVSPTQTTTSPQVAAITAEPKSAPPATMTALGGTPTARSSVARTLAEEDEELRNTIKRKYKLTA